MKREPNEKKKNETLAGDVHLVVNNDCLNKFSCPYGRTKTRTEYLAGTRLKRRRFNDHSGYKNRTTGEED